MEDSKRIIEIDGVKVEVDLRTAKRVESFKVGDNIKILDKEYDTYKVKPGIIVDFAEFQELPTIIYYNKNTSKKVEIVSCSEDEIKVSKEGVIERFEREIQKKKNEYEDLKNKLEYFKTHFLKVYKEI